jgi:hypothetical protein
VTTLATNLLYGGQWLRRFAACEHREVIDAVKRAMAAALLWPSALVIHGMPLMRHVGRRCRWSSQQCASKECGRTAW